MSANVTLYQLNVNRQLFANIQYLPYQFQKVLICQSHVYNVFCCPRVANNLVLLLYLKDFSQLIAPNTNKS